jgi:two-component system sensor histidine kinase VicK
LRTVIAQQQATTLNHQLVLDAPTSLIGEWDATRISEVLTNLVSNAIRYSVDGGKIRITVDEAGELVIVRVIDPGIGIAPDLLPRLFQPFSQLSSEPTTNGAGLGLYIAKAIVELHGGQIWAKSAEGKGSTFSVALPRWQRYRHNLY